MFFPFRKEDVRATDKDKVYFILYFTCESLNTDKLKCLVSEIMHYVNKAQYSRIEAFPL